MIKLSVRLLAFNEFLCSYYSRIFMKEKSKEIWLWVKNYKKLAEKYEVTSPYGGKSLKAKIASK